MAHTTRKKIKLLARVARLRGQLEAIERALAVDLPCIEVLNLAASMRGAMNGLTAELIEDHIREHVVDSDGGNEKAREQGAEELKQIIKRYLR